MDTAQGRRSYPCPECGSPSGVAECHHCGRGPDRQLRALAEIDDQLIVRGAEADRLRDELNTVTRQIASLRRRRSALAADLTTRRHASNAARAARATQQWNEPATVVPQPTGPDVTIVEPPPVAIPSQPGPRPGPSPESTGSRAPEASTRSVQNILLSLGGVLSAAAIIVFTAVAWATFGSYGRAAILTAITIALMAAPLWIVKRGLAATAETVAGLAVLMLPCDAVALYLLRLFPATGTETVIAEPATREFDGTISAALTTGVHTPGVAIGLLVITGIAVAYRMLTRMIVPGFAVAGLGALTLLIAVVQFSVPLGVGALVTAAAIQALAAGLFGRHPARRSRTAGIVLVHTCGCLAVVSLLAAVGYGTGRTMPAYTLLALTAAGAVLLAIARRLPGDWRSGPMWTVHVALTGAAVTAVGLGLVVAARWLLLPLPPWHAELAVPGWVLDDGHPFGWRLTATIVILTIVAAALLPEHDGPGGRTRSRSTGFDAVSAVPRWQVRRLGLALAGGVLAVLTVPSALGLSWRASALLLTGVALIVVAGSLAVADRRLSRALLISAIPLGLNAIVLSAGGAATMLTVLLALFGCLVVLAVIALLRGRWAQSGALFGTALWTLAGALPVSWYLLGLAPTHTAVLSGIVASGIAVLATYPLTRFGPTSYRRFMSRALIGVLGGIATGAFVAVGVATAAGGSPFVTAVSVVNPFLYLGIALLLTSTVDTRPRPGPTAATPDLSRIRARSASLATIALLVSLGGYISMWAPSDTLPGYVVVSLLAAATAKLLPRRWGDGPDRGAWTVAAVATGFAALAALSTVPALFGLTPALPWLDWRVPIMLAVVAAASLVLLPSGARRPVAATTATLALLCVPVAWPTPWWAGPALFVTIAVAYALWTVLAPPHAARSIGAAETPRHDDPDGSTTATDDDHGPAAPGGSSPNPGSSREDHPKTPLATLWTRGLLALAFAGYGLAAAALHPYAPDRPTGYALAAGLAALLVLVCAGVAVLGYRRQPTVGGFAVATGLVLAPGAVVLAGMSLRLAAEPIQQGAMAAACFGLLVAAGLRFGAPRYLSWATLVVPPVAVACARAGLPSDQSGMYVAVAGLVGVGAAMLMLPNRRAAVIRTGLSGVAIVATLVKVLPLSVATLVVPYRWTTAVWTETPLTTVAGLTPGSTPRLLIDATGWDLAILAVCVTTIALAALGLAGRGWGVGAAFVAMAIALPTVPVVFDLPWPALPFTTLAIAVAAYVLSTHVRLPASQLSILVIVALVCCGTGFTGSLATRATTLTALTVLSIGTVTGGLLGASPARRATGWLLSSVTVTGLVIAAGFAVELPPSRLPYGIVAVAALFLALASARTRLTGTSTWAAEAAGHLVAVTAIAAAAAVSATAAATVSTPAITLIIHGALLGLLAVRADPADDGEQLLGSKRWYAAGSIAAAFAAYWLLLADAKVSVIEVYTVPFALATLLAGWLELRRRPRLRSWTAYAPGLCLLLLPPLAQILLTEDEPLRRLGLGVANVAILLLGTRQRFQAPVVVATIMLVVQAGYEITLLWTLVPSWLPLAIGGVLLLSLGATFEKRRRDLRRLRGALADMR